MSRFPISARLTAAFALAMAVVLAVTCVWIYERQSDGYDRSIDRRLRDRRDAAASIVNDSGERRVAGVARELREADSGPVQVYLRNGDILESSAVLRSRRLASTSDVARSTSRSQWHDVWIGTDPADHLRVLFVRTGNPDLALALAESTGPAHEALERLAVQLLAGASFAVLLGSLLAFSLARAALRPVERLRVEASRRGPDDDVVLPVSPARDEIARLAVTLNELLQRMRAATLRERRFVAEAGHELRTPLATMIAEIELALEGDVPHPIATMRSMHGEALRLAMLAEQLLQLSTIREGTAYETIDLAALVAHRVRRARLAYPEHDIHVGRAFEGECSVDPHAIQRALDNLIVNAATHGGPRIVVETQEAGTFVELHVLDDGAGIDDAVAARAFERFARADDARTRPGTGLGLSIVQGIASAHAGTAGITHRTDGTTGTDAWFTVRRDRPVEKPMD